MIKKLLVAPYRLIDADNSWSDLSPLYLSIGKTKTLRGYAPIPVEERDRLINPSESGPRGLPDSPYQPKPPSTDLGKGIPQISTSLRGSTRQINLLTITGRWRFFDRNDNRTSTHLLVQIIRGDNNTVLASCYTDANGFYSCGPFTNPGSAGVRSRLLTFVTDTATGNTLVTVDPSVGTAGTVANAYRVTTEIRVFADGTRDIGAREIPNGDSVERAFWIMQDLIRVWLYIWNQTGSSQTPQESAGSATVEWSFTGTDGDYYQSGGNIHLRGNSPLSNTVVGHEYGHNIMYTVYGNWMPTSNCPSPHFIQRSSNVTCAWTEGWANFLTMAVNNDPVYRWETGGSVNLEIPTWGTPGWDNGDAVEGRVAGALWDILDNLNDGTDTYTDVNIVNIWDTLFHQNDDNFRQYSEAWIARGHPAVGPENCLLQNTIDY